MSSYNAANERMKRQYFAYLAEAQGHSEQTIDAVAKAIARFEAYTRYKDFKTFHIEQAKGFKRRPCRPTGPPERRAAEQGDALRHPDRAEAVLHLAGRTARLQIPHRLFRRRVLQPFDQGDADRQSHPPGARSDPGANSPCHPVHARDHRY